MHRFFVNPEQINNDEITIQGTDFNHIKNVLRLRIGEKIQISNGQGESFYCIIKSINDKNIATQIIEYSNNNSELKTKIYLFQGLPKKDKFELIIQKAVELGVYEIIPVITARTIVKLDEKKEHKKGNRWDSIAESASKQANRNIIPMVKTPMSFKEAIKYASQFDKNLIPYEMAADISKSRDIINNINCSSIGIFIGPEGGFEESEINLAIEHGVIPITLGKRILRTETAGIAVMSLLMFNIEED